MIRDFNREDFEIIYKLGNEISKNFSKTNNLEEIYQDDYTKILVYENNNQVVGFLMYTELPDMADIIDIIVMDEYRKKNIASCLLDNLFSRIKESVKIITLEVRKSNTPAINLYKKFGFEIVNTRKEYYEDEDAYLMGRVI